MVKDHDKKEISDLSLVAWLQIRGHKWISYRTEPRKVIFVFRATEKLETDIMKFLDRSAKVDALSFSEALRGLKNLCFRVMESPPDQNSGNGSRA
jgi:hypothetical protein